MKVSIIVPVYNVAPYITDCLQSVINQTYTDLEVLLIDDCGTDDSIQIAERIVQEYKGSIQFRILHHDRNRGLSAGRNTGIDEAKGEYISFIDSDDYIAPDFYEKMIGVMERCSKDVGILSCFFKFDTEGIISDFITDVKSEITIMPEDYAETMLLMKYPHVVWGKIFRKEMFDNTRFRVGRNNEDLLFVLDFFPEVERRKIKTVIIPDKLYYYRQRKGSICHSLETPFFLDLIYNYEEMLTNIKYIKPNIYKCQRNGYIRILFHSILSLLDMGEDKKQFYYKCCRKLWNIPNTLVYKLFNLSDFKVFCMMKYMPYIYYYIYASRKRT